MSKIKLHFGCGSNILKGWENLDLPNTDITKPLRYKDNSIDFIFNEHVIEHVDEVDGFKFIKECYRILKPGGVLRISCPSIDGIINAYINFKTLDPDWRSMFDDNRDKFINSVIYYEAAFYNGKKFGKNFEEIIVSNGKQWHKYMYSKGDFKNKLNLVGFSEVKFLEKHESDHPELVGLERRLGGKFEKWPKCIDVNLEAKK